MDIEELTNEWLRIGQRIEELRRDLEDDNPPLDRFLKRIANEDI